MKNIETFRKMPEIFKFFRNIFENVSNDKKSKNSAIIALKFH